MPALRPRDAAQHSVLRRRRICCSDAAVFFCSGDCGTSSFRLRMTRGTGVHGGVSCHGRNGSAVAGATVSIGRGGTRAPPRWCGRVGRCAPGNRPRFGSRHCHASGTGKKRRLRARAFQLCKDLLSPVSKEKKIFFPRTKRRFATYPKLEVP